MSQERLTGEPEGGAAYGSRTLVLRRRHRWKLVVAGAAVLGALVLMYLLSDIFTPLLLALLIAYVLNPVVTWLERRGISRGRAVFYIYVLLGLAMALILAIGVPLLVRQAADWTWAARGEYMESPAKGAADPLVTKVQGERYTDANGNKRCDAGEPFVDSNRNGRYDPGELLTLDRNRNGAYDDGDRFADTNGNGRWDPAESFQDLNGNGFRDEPEPFTDLNGNGRWDEWLYYRDMNGNSVPDGGYIDRIRTAARDERHWFGSMLARLGGAEWRERAVDALLRRARENASAIAARSAEFAAGGARALFNTASRAAYLALAIVLVPIYTYFFLLGLNELRDTAVSYIPRNVRGDVVRILGEIHEINAAFFRGRLLICLMMGAVSTAGFLAFGLRFSLIFGAAMTVAGLVPFLPIVVMVPAALVALVDLPWWGVLGVLASGAAGQALDWPLTTYLMGRRLRLHPITIVVTLFVFTRLLGTVGLLLSVPIAAALKVVGRELILPHLDEIADGPPTSSDGIPLDGR